MHVCEMLNSNKPDFSMSNILITCNQFTGALPLSAHEADWKGLPYPAAACVQSSAASPAVLSSPPLVAEGESPARQSVVQAPLFPQ